MNHIKDIQEKLTKLSEAYIKSIILPIQLRAKEMELLFAPISNLMKSIDFEKISKIKERLDNIGRSDFEYKWLLSLSIPLGNKLIELYEKGGNEKVNEYLIKSFRDKENIEAFKEWLDKQQPYKERKQIIDDCLQAHFEEKFTLSIPVLLAQCDGIIINKVVEKAKYTGREADYVNMKKVANDGRVDINNHLAEHIINIYNNKRLGILHGKDFRYYKDGEELSVKVIWTLFEIIHFASQIK